VGRCAGCGDERRPTSGALCRSARATAHGVVDLAADAAEPVYGQASWPPEEGSSAVKRFTFLTVLLTVALLATAMPTASAVGQGQTFVAPSSGAQEVPPNDSLARGQAIFRLSADGDELHYRLIVANLHNVTQAHIHLAPVGVNGPVVAWLYPSAPPAQMIPGRSSGVLATGTITGTDLVGPLAGHDLSALIEAMEAGDTYVNVHTSQFPPGEVRGQIR
jgi:hypothetical protein